VSGIFGGCSRSIEKGEMKDWYPVIEVNPVIIVWDKPSGTGLLNS
jgi:hypothetical protein